MDENKINEEIENKFLEINSIIKKMVKRKIILTS
jgi:hypothetical protein